jgi:NADPH:quinone reductase-like Zn-dependent oxidoreductase
MAASYSGRSGKRPAGQTVLINGASGGIGTFAVQLAKALGAEVTAVASTRNLDLLRSVGADHAIDYTAEDFTSRGKLYDVILDNVSNHSLSACAGALAATGVLIPNGGNFGKPMVRAPVGSSARRSCSVRHAAPRELPRLHEPMTISSPSRPDRGRQGHAVLDRTYPLSRGAALDHVGDGHAQGKVAITV